MNIKGNRILLEETREVLNDYTAIANVDDNEQEQIENDEQDFMEVLEYVRMAAYSVFLENKPEKISTVLNASDSNSLH